MPQRDVGSGERGRRTLIVSSQRKGALRGMTDKIISILRRFESRVLELRRSDITNGVRDLAKARDDRFRFV